MNPIPPPLGLIAEVTHRCPLQCPYCSNPLELVRPGAELDTESWKRVIEQAASLGVLQFHFTGGEPLARADIVTLVGHAAAHGLYTNIITSGVGLTEELLERLVAAGVDHLQLSFQDVDPAPADRMAGYRGAFARKMQAAALIRAAGLPLTLNFVIYRANTANVPRMIALGEGLGAARIEIAHVQYYGWALKNRNLLLPTREQLDFVTEVVEAARARLRGRVVIDYVVPDYYAARPKACMGGWGQRFITVDPAGRVLPCHAATTLPGFVFANVRERGLGEIWERDPAFSRFRGTAWMPEPCRSCERRETDWGGCRCQAFALTGEAARTDPACALSPDHALMQEVVRARGESPPEPVFRRLRSAAAPA